MYFRTDGLNAALQAAPALQELVWDGSSVKLTTHRPGAPGIRLAALFAAHTAWPAGFHPWRRASPSTGRHACQRRSGAPDRLQRQVFLVTSQRGR